MTGGRGGGGGGGGQRRPAAGGAVAGGSRLPGSPRRGRSPWGPGFARGAALVFRSPALLREERVRQLPPPPPLQPRVLFPLVAVSSPQWCASLCSSLLVSGPPACGAASLPPSPPPPVPRSGRPPLPLTGLSPPRRHSPQRIIPPRFHFPPPRPCLRPQRPTTGRRRRSRPGTLPLAAPARPPRRPGGHPPRRGGIRERRRRRCPQPCPTPPPLPTGPPAAPPTVPGRRPATPPWRPPRVRPPALTPMTSPRRCCGCGGRRAPRG